MKYTLYISAIVLLSNTVCAESAPSQEKVVKAVADYVECLKSGEKYNDGIICGAYFPSYEYIELSKTCLLTDPIEYYSGLTIIYRCEGNIILSANIGGNESGIVIEGVYEVVP